MCWTLAPFNRILQCSSTYFSLPKYPVFLSYLQPLSDITVCYKLYDLPVFLRPSLHTQTSLLRHKTRSSGTLSQYFSSPALARFTPTPSSRSSHRTPGFRLLSPPLGHLFEHRLLVVQPPRLASFNDPRLPLAPTFSRSSHRYLAPARSSLVLLNSLISGSRSFSHLSLIDAQLASCRSYCRNKSGPTIYQVYFHIVFDFSFETAYFTLTELLLDSCRFTLSLQERCVSIYATQQLS